MASVVWMGDKATLAEARGRLVPAANGKIAFIRSSEPSDRRTSRIITMNPDGTDQRFLAETTDGSQLAWSPRAAATVAGGRAPSPADQVEKATTRSIAGTTRTVTTTWRAMRPAFLPSGGGLGHRKRSVVTARSTTPFRSR
jgi:hypothetical protein